MNVSKGGPDKFTKLPAGLGQKIQINSDYSYSGEEDNGCPHCLAPKDDLGALSRHWNTSCGSKVQEKGVIDTDEQHRLESFKKKKQEMSILLTRALNRALCAPCKQARCSQAHASESSSSDEEDNILFTAEPCPTTSMSSAKPIPDSGSEEATVEEMTVRLVPR